MEEIDSYGPLGKTMRRRRNVTIYEPEDQRQSEHNASIGIKWGDESKIAEHNSYNELEGNNPWKEPDMPPLTNCEKALAMKNQGTTREFVIGGCALTIGLLGTKVSKGSQKLTVYLDPELIDALKDLKKAKLISSCSWLVSESLQQYLICNSK